MKEKNRIYSNLKIESIGRMPLSTMALFQKGPKGKLVHAPRVRPDGPHRNPLTGERRIDLRREYRHDATCREMTAQGPGAAIEARVCEVSAGGFSLLLDQAIEPGSYLEIRVAEVDARWPLAQVMRIRPKGNVWFASGCWLHKLPEAAMAYLFGEPEEEERCEMVEAEAVEHPSLLMRLWLRFHRRAA
jgi:hypothetical protein